MRKLMDIADAVKHVKTGDTIMVGGFGLIGAPLA